jgi:hypothetical protein
MRVEEVAALLAVKPSTVYELSRRQQDPLPSVRIGLRRRPQPGSRTKQVKPDHRQHAGDVEVRPSQISTPASVRLNTNSYKNVGSKVVNPA